MSVVEVAVPPPSELVDAGVAVELPPPPEPPGLKVAVELELDARESFR